MTFATGVPACVYMTGGPWWVTGKWARQAWTRKGRERSERDEPTPQATFSKSKSLCVLSDFNKQFRHSELITVAFGNFRWVCFLLLLIFLPCHQRRSPTGMSQGLRTRARGPPLLPPLCLHPLGLILLCHLPVSDLLGLISSMRVLELIGRLRFINCTWRFADAYHSGLTGKAAEWAVCQQKSHQSASNTAMAALEAAAGQP